MPAAAIVLAAGASRRLGQPKQLVEYCGETLLERGIRLARDAGASPVFVVLGAHADAIRARVSLQNAIPVLNGDWEQGIAGSIHAGIHALEEKAPEMPGVLIMSCDQPQLTAAHLRALMDAFDAHAGTSIVASRYAGVLGVPAVFPREAFAQLMALRGDKGARALLQEPPCAVQTVDFPGGEEDIDTPADLAKLD